MKNSSVFLAIALTAAFAVTSKANLVITGIVDGPLTGGTPKALEIYVLSDVADLSIYSIANANNGAAAFSAGNALSGSATAGQFLYAVSNDGATFNSYFGFSPTFTSIGALNINGDDVVGILQGSTVVDVYGELGVDGTGTAWDHLDGWGYRVSGTSPSSTFNVADWTFSGVDALDGTTTNSGASNPFPIGTYAPAAIPEPSSFAVLGIAAASFLAARRRMTKAAK